MKLLIQAQSKKKKKKAVMLSTMLSGSQVFEQGVMVDRVGVGTGGR